MANFIVGEIAIICQSELLPELLGKECVITDGLKERTNKYFSSTQFCYLITVQGEGTTIFCCQPHALRKKFPPKTYTGEMRIRELFNESPVTA